MLCAMKKDNKYSLKRKVETKYWKYNYVSWTRPNLENAVTEVPEGTIVCSTNSMSSERVVYGPLDGKLDGYKTVWGTANTSKGWWSVKFPYLIKITGLIHYNGYSSTANVMNITGRYYAGSDMLTPIGDAISTSSANYAETVIQNIPEEGIITDTIYFNKTGGAAFSGIGELKITATKYAPIEATPDDYDFTTEEKTYFAFKKG